MNPGKYINYSPITLSNRQWPNRLLNKAPLWCSVDLSDANRALIEPMSLSEQLSLFELLVKLGFKEIEISAPSSSEAAYLFIRHLIEKNLIPKDVFIQVPLPACERTIKENLLALQGCKNIILHLYNSTSMRQREIVLRSDRQAIIQLAVNATKLIQALIPSLGATKVKLQYSPEGFSGTEPEFALAICNAVIDAWQPSAEDKLILNLPANVELTMPNIYADQIEWFCQHINQREQLIISVHTLNDRGTAVAASELAMLAGAERIEASLFGNGERAGNASSITLALNLLTQGIDPKLNITDIHEIVTTVEACTKMKIPARQPYAGELVFTAFADPIQQAINKGLTLQQIQKKALWEVPYLIIDPQDIGRNYGGLAHLSEPIDKSSVCYLLEKKLGYQLPLELWVEFSKQIRKISDTTDVVLNIDKLQSLFKLSYVEVHKPFHLLAINFDSPHIQPTHKKLACRLIISYMGQTHEVQGEGMGIIDTVKTAISHYFQLDFNVSYYSQHALSVGSDAKAISYIKLSDDYGRSFWGVGIDENTTLSSLKSFITALNRSCENTHHTKVAEFI